MPRAAITPPFFLRLGLWIGLTLAWLSANAGAAVYEWDNDLEQIQITDYEVLISDKGLSPETVASETFADQWRPRGEQSLIGTNDGGSKAGWIRFRLHGSSKSKPLWLVPSWATLPSLQLSLRDEATGQWWHSRKIGFKSDSDSLYLHHRYFLIPLELEAGQSVTAYLHLSSPELTAVPISLWDQLAFASKDQQQLLIHGLFFGSLLIMLLYNLSLYTVLRDKAYLLYSVYVAAVMAYESAMSGIGYYYFWNGSLWLSEHAVLLFASLSFLTATLFVRQFLSLPAQGPWIKRINDGFVMSFIVLSVLSATTVSMWLADILKLFGALTCVVGIGTGVVLWRRGNKIAELFTYAWTILSLTTIVHVMTLADLLPMNLFTRYSQVAGFVIELVLLSFALAYRINTEREQRERAQAETLNLTMRVSEERNEKLRAQIQTLAIQKKLNDELERRVAHRTEQLEDAMKSLERANAELTKLSITDPLTKVANRRYFDDMLLEEYKRACRLQHSIALVLLDIDHFKPINDNHGHYVGDECLSLVANAIKAAAKRPGDLTARYGGEEFVMILPGCTESAGAEVAEQARQAVAALAYRAGSKDIPLTVSAGVAAWIPDRDSNMEALLKAADSALYRAKRAGRNRVVKASAEGKVIPLQGHGE